MQSVRKVTYAYDALGRRVSTTTLEGTVRHVYDGVQCIADLDSDGEVVASYTWGAGTDNLLAISVNGATYSASSIDNSVLQNDWGFRDGGESVRFWHYGR